MSGINQKIEEIVLQSPKSSWKEKVEWRKANKDWLRKSSAIAFRILDVLDEKGWKKNRLAQELGVTSQQVSKYVKGEENFKLETISKLEKVLGLELVTTLQNDEEVVQKGTWKYVESDNQAAKIEIDKKDVFAYLAEPIKMKDFSYAEAA